MPIAVNMPEDHEDGGLEIQNVTHLERKRSAYAIVRAMCLTANPTKFSSNFLYNMLEHAKKIEQDIYKDAKSNEEYFRLLAEKEASLRTEMEEKVQQRQDETAQNKDDPEESFFFKFRISYTRMETVLFVRSS